MADRPRNDGELWTRDALVIAFELYCRTPFQRTKANNPEVRRTAQLLGRTPSSVARKLGNFGAFDPQLRERGISGLPHGSHLDRRVWDEFHHDWNTLVEEARRLREVFGEPEPAPETFLPPSGPSERLRMAKARIHQDFFRQAVLSSYDCRCCVTGIRVRECLIASHIVPWAQNEAHRADPRNGLCLSATLDRLFDCGLFTIGEDFSIDASPQLRESEDRACRVLLACYHGKPMMRPERFAPAPEYLSWHRDNVFRA